MSSGTHEKLVLEAGILEKLIDVVIEMSEKDEENVSVWRRFLNSRRSFLAQLLWDEAAAEIPRVMFCGSPVNEIKWDLDVFLPSAWFVPRSMHPVRSLTVLQFTLKIRGPLKVLGKRTRSVKVLEKSENLSRSLYLQRTCIARIPLDDGNQSPLDLLQC